MPAIHYNSTMKLMVLKSAGQGECGKNGIISPYEGMITCKVCLEIYRKENKPNE